MASLQALPALQGWEPTRDTLKWYSRAVGAIPRAHAEAHPKWWHVSLKVAPEGLATDPMALPDGGTFGLKMDLTRHLVALETSLGERREFSLTAGQTATQLADQLIAATADLGLSGEYNREKFESDDPRPYDPDDAGKYLQAVTAADRVFKTHRAGLGGDLGPVQLWPHGFDLAFEWFGTRQIEYEEGGEVTTYPSQLNFGFSPGEESHPTPYFYSNPWPFEAERLVHHELPSGARWFTESWEGSMLPYEMLAGDPHAESKLLAYLQAVYRISSPTLMVE